MSQFTFSHLALAVEEMSQSIRHQDFITFFRKLSLIDATETTVTLGVASMFHKDNLSKKFYTEIKNAIVKVFPSIIAVDFSVDENIEERGSEEVIDCRSISKKTAKEAKKAQVQGVEVVE